MFSDMYTCKYVCACTYVLESVYTYIYVYAEREREREGEREKERERERPSCKA